MPRLIWVFAGRTAILLVLSCRGSNVLMSLYFYILEINLIRVLRCWQNILTLVSVYRCYSFASNKLCKWFGCCCCFFFCFCFFSSSSSSSFKLREGAGGEAVPQQVPVSKLCKWLKISIERFVTRAKLKYCRNVSNSKKNKTVLSLLHGDIGFNF